MTSTNGLSSAQLKQKTVDYLNEISNQNRLQKEILLTSKLNNDSILSQKQQKLSNNQENNNNTKTYKRRYLMPQTPRVKLRLSSSSDNSFFHRYLKSCQ